MNAQSFLRTLLTLSISIFSLSSCPLVALENRKNKEDSRQKDNLLSVDHSDSTKSVIPVKTKKLRKNRKAIAAQRNEYKLTNQTKTLSQMNFEEIKAAKTLLLEKNSKHIAVKYIDRMIKLCENITTIGDLTIELADLHFDLGEFTKAEKLFTQFSSSYPGSSSVEYASYKAILSSFYETLIAERDQTKTHHTIALTDSFIERKDVFTKYAGDVLDIRTSCYKKAVESEINIFNFYLNRGKLLSAQSRLNSIRKDWTEKFPEITMQLTHMELQLHDKALLLAGNKPVKQKASPSLLNQAPQEPTLIAQADTAAPEAEKGKKKTTFSARF